MLNIGLLAGVGRLPVEFTKAAQGMGAKVVAVGVVPGVDAELAQAAHAFAAIGVGQLRQIIDYLKLNQVTQVTMLGKVTKELMFSGGVALDQEMQALLALLPDHNDDTIMLGFVKRLAMEGIGVLDQTALLKPLMPEAGVLTERQPSKVERADMTYGFRMAKAIGGLDIGQTVVVKDAAVLAVEAIEGTDACIRRGGSLGRGEVTVVKVAKPQQDNRFDIPAIGPATLKAMIEAGAKSLAMEAGHTLLVDRSTVLRLAAENDITIVAMNEQ
ncbi:LpxI family protein [Azotosporobacter soli]|uniref:LpxI family protein n=1 Tax=Azotosporobacter soli TaxID=3055040 RepID=UPI0031FE8955